MLLFHFLRCWNVTFIIVLSENSYVIRLSNSGLQKTCKIIKIPYFLSHADVSNKFAKFQRFDKKMTNSMFFHPNILIKTKYKSQEEEKVGTENSISIQSKICQVLPIKRVIT